MTIENEDIIDVGDEEISQEDKDQLTADLAELSAGESKEDREVKTEPEVKSEGAENTDDDLGPEHDDKTDEERTAIRERRRIERQQKKIQAKEREESYKREIAGLRKQVNEFNEWKNKQDHRQHQSGMAQIDNAIRETEETLELAKRSLKEATASQNGEALADANELYYAARRRKEELENIKQRVVQQTQQPQRPTIDPMVVKQAKSWMDKKEWYDPVSQNTDTRIVMMLDKELNNEGWDPRTPEYWEELDERAKKYIPHRYQGQKASVDTPTGYQERRPPTGGSGNTNRQGGASYTLSPERVRALKEAGMWDDPVKRKGMIKRYMEMDKANK